MPSAIGTERTFEDAARECAEAFRASPALYYISGWEGRVALLKFYGDESFGRRQSGSQGCYVVAGYLADSDGWKDVTRDFDAVLKTPPVIEYFHMTECLSVMESRQKEYDPGAFAGLSPQQARDKLDALIRVLELHHRVIKTAQSVVTWDVFTHALGPLDKRLTPSPYYLCLMGVVRCCWYMLTEYKLPIVPVSFVFDEKIEESGRVLDAWNTVKAFGPYADNSLSPIMGSIGFADDRQCIPLQCADLFAWHVRRDYIAPAEDHGRPRPEYTRLTRARGGAAMYQPNEQALREERAALLKRFLESQKMKLEPTDKLPETAEGPEAFVRFRNAVKKVLSAPKIAELEKTKPTKARRKPNPRG